MQAHANTYQTLTSKEQSVVHAVWSLSSKKVFVGTGFFISPNRIVTNAHIIEGLLQNAELENIKLLQENAEGRVESIKITKIVALSAIFDLAILETDKSTDTYLNIRTSQVTETEDLLTIIGYPQGEFFKLSQTSALQILVDKLAFFVNHYPLEGVSGSPVLDETNQVVGVASNGYENFLLATSSEQLNLLIAGEIGIQCDEDYKKCIQEGLELAIKKAEQGDTLAQYYLSEMSILNFSGLFSISTENKDKILGLMQKTTEQEDMFSQHNLALMYLQGIGVEQNLKKSFNLFQAAAEKGFVSSQFFTGSMYFHGLGVEKNLEEVAIWFTKAAVQGHVLAQVNLGSMYFHGLGVEKNLAEAREWFTKAAEQEFAPAQEFLKIMDTFIMLRTL